MADTSDKTPIRLTVGRNDFGEIVRKKFGFIERDSDIVTLKQSLKNLMCYLHAHFGVKPMNSFY